MTNSSKTSSFTSTWCHSKLYSDELDFTSIVVSAVVIDEKPTWKTLPTLFSATATLPENVLSDYDLLKTHHLRYIPSTGNMPRKMGWSLAMRWRHPRKQDELLQQMLFRLRNWRSGTQFRLNASNTSGAGTFSALRRECWTIGWFCSIRPSGNSVSTLFWLAVENFSIMLSIITKDMRLFVKLRLFKNFTKSFSGTVTGDSMQHTCHCISFLIASMAISIWTMLFTLWRTIFSRLRNEYQGPRQLFGGELFQKCTADLDRSTAEGEFISILMDSKQRYDVSNRGKTANLYWESLFQTIGVLWNRESSGDVHAHYRSSNFKETKWWILNKCKHRFIPKNWLKKLSTEYPDLSEGCFVWETSQIEQLFSDLQEAYEKSPDAPYYIGIITHL